MKRNRGFFSTALLKPLATSRGVEIVLFGRPKATHWQQPERADNPVCV